MWHLLTSIWPGSGRGTEAESMSMFVFPFTFLYKIIISSSEIMLAFILSHSLFWMRWEFKKIFKSELQEKKKIKKKSELQGISSGQ